MKDVVWQKTVRRLVRAVCVYSLAEVASCLFRMRGGWEWSWKSLSGGEWSSVEFVLFWMRTCDGWSALLTFVGYYLFFRGVSRFVALQGDAGDRESACRVRTGYEWLMVGGVFSYLPGVGWWLRLAAVVVAAVNLWEGFDGLRRSAVLPGMAQVGAAMLRWCAVGNAVAVVAGMVPVTGAALEGMVFLVVWVASLKGWDLIRRAPREAAGELPDRGGAGMLEWKLSGWLTWVLAFWWSGAVYALSCALAFGLEGEGWEGRLVVGQRLGMLLCWVYALWRWRRMRFGIVGEIGLMVLFLLNLYSGMLMLMASIPYSLLVPGYPLAGELLFDEEWAGWQAVAGTVVMALVLCRTQLPLALKVGVPCFYVVCFALSSLVAWAAPAFFGESGVDDFSEVRNMICGSVMAVYVAALYVLLRRWQQKTFLQY